jgi:rod shape-determining protein MreD
MVETSAPTLWSRRALYLAAAGVLILAGLVPIGGAPRTLPPPEALFALTLAWVARRPREVPALSVAAVFLLADLLFMRPPGLHALAVVAAAEWLRAHPTRAGDPLGEWGRAGAAILVAGLAEQAALALTLTDGPPLGPALARSALTAAVYPVAALLVWTVFGARRPPRGETEATP